VKQTYILKLKKDTAHLANLIAPQLRIGDVLALSGELGAGKTFFTQCLCHELGIKEPVTSPTFVILNEYFSGSIPVFHFDLYRLHSEHEVLDLGITDMIDQGITVIEWPELLEGIISRITWKLSFHYDGTKRWVDVEKFEVRCAKDEVSRKK
jgi:tRNA threonylcarbamoyladenosine biosynthesis protein TsaE